LARRRLDRMIREVVLRLVTRARDSPRVDMRRRGACPPFAISSPSFAFALKQSGD
jgi:hypothetical protein